MDTDRRNFIRIGVGTLALSVLSCNRPSPYQMMLEKRNSECPYQGNNSGPVTTKLGWSVSEAKFLNDVILTLTTTLPGKNFSNLLAVWPIVPGNDKDARGASMGVVQCDPESKTIIVSRGHMLLEHPLVLVTGLDHELNHAEKDGVVISAEQATNAEIRANAVQANDAVQISTFLQEQGRLTPEGKDALHRVVLACQLNVAAYEAKRDILVAYGKVHNSAFAPLEDRGALGPDDSKLVHSTTDAYRYAAEVESRGDYTQIFKAYEMLLAAIGRMRSSPTLNLPAANLSAVSVKANQAFYNMREKYSLTLPIRLPYIDERGVLMKPITNQRIGN